MLRKDDTPTERRRVVWPVQQPVQQEEETTRRGVWVVSCLAVLVIAGVVGAAEFKVYPGAKLDAKATREANEAAKAAKQTGVTAAIYTSGDSFQKVASFYKELGKEYAMPNASGTVGKPKKRGNYALYEAFFILDDGKDLASSKRWVKVQRPHIGEAVKDVTAIILSEKK